ncbi:GNAT family N-acetyltransferase [Skermanella pratensis]|uniref:GNAT family N-acetyltransferase n=1 Tax=Skermanella pratensis TaxID=2233999 RepID=UPI001300E7EB|nr:GNAT family N-acetyltransferase [Skermanella pratensis]
MAEVTDNQAHHRYEMDVNGTVAFMNYRLKDDVIALVHTEVPESLSGQGVGSKLVRGVLDDVRGRGLKVEPYCTFVQGYVERHSEYQDLILPIR